MQRSADSIVPGHSPSIFDTGQLLVTQRMTGIGTKASPHQPGMVRSPAPSGDCRVFLSQHGDKELGRG